MKFLYYILHSIFTCKDEDLEWYKDKAAICKKCGRITFNWRY